MCDVHTFPDRRIRTVVFEIDHHLDLGCWICRYSFSIALPLQSAFERLGVNLLNHNFGVAEFFQRVYLSLLDSYLLRGGDSLKLCGGAAGASGCQVRSRNSAATV